MTGSPNSAKAGTPWPPLLVIVATCWVVSLIVLVIAVAGMRYATGSPRLIPISGLESPDAYDSQLIVESDRKRFRRELAPIVAKNDTKQAEVLAILEWVMNQIPRVENRYRKSSWQMVELGRAGGGLICSGMAQIFRDALLAQDIPARRVFLQRNLFDSYDTHVTVEAFVDGKWRIYDPTFHLSLKANNQRVGAEEARRWFLNRKGERVEVEFLGDVRYPARYDSYPIRYEVLFNNVYVELNRSQGFVGAFPLLGVWLGPPWGYQEHVSGLSTMAQDSYRFLYYTTFVVLPLINMLLLLAMVLLWRKCTRSRTSFPSLPI